MCGLNFLNVVCASIWIYLPVKSHKGFRVPPSEKFTVGLAHEDVIWLCVLPFLWTNDRIYFAVPVVYDEILLFASQVRS